jgi:hypothetical protein
MGKDQKPQDRGNRCVKEKPAPACNWLHLKGQNCCSAGLNDQHYAERYREHGHAPERMHDQHDSPKTVHYAEQ